jgi:hypothetical protein
MTPVETTLRGAANREQVARFEQKSMPPSPASEAYRSVLAMCRGNNLRLIRSR